MTELDDLSEWTGVLQDQAEAIREPISLKLLAHLGLAARDHYRKLRDQAAVATEKPNNFMYNHNDWLLYMEKSLADSSCVCSRMTIDAAARAAKSMHERLLKVELERSMHAGRDYHEELIEENSIPSYAEFDAIGPWMKRIRVRLSKETASVVEYYLPEIAKAALDVHREMIAEMTAPDGPPPAAEPGPNPTPDRTQVLLSEIATRLDLFASRMLAREKDPREVDRGLALQGVAAAIKDCIYK